MRTLLTLLFLAGTSLAQDMNRVELDKQETEHFANDPLPEIEKELADLARIVLEHEVTEYKDYSNARFINMMGVVLQREDSYNYPFDSLETVSRIFPEDQSFRIFTWVLVDQDKARTKQNYHHFGLIQRRYSKDGKTAYKVIALNDRMDKTPTIESDILTPDRWLGALYYKPRNADYGVMTYKGKFMQVDGLTGKHKKVKATYYVLLGFNGHDRRNNYKIVDCISFPDPEDPAKINFGAPMFYFGEIPKSRAVFKYSDNTIFNLNTGFVTDEKGKHKQEALVFDHLESAYRDRNDTNSVASKAERIYGPGGAYDALVWINKVNKNRKGFFYFFTEVNVYYPEMEGRDPEEIRRQAEEERRRLKEANVLEN